MGLRRAHYRSAMWSSLLAVAVVGAVVGANLWSIWHAEPEPASLDALQRLTALQHDNRALLPASAEASAADALAGTLDAAPTSAGARSAVHVTAPATTSGKTRELTRSCTVQPGESLGAALGHLYIQGATQRQVIDAYTRLRKPERLQAGWRLWARFAVQGESALADGSTLLAVVVAPNHGEGVTVARNEGSPSGFAAAEGGLPGTVVRQALRCPVSGSLDQAIRRCGGDEALAAHVGLLLADRLHPPVELHPGDEVRLVFDNLMDGDALVRHLGIAAVQVRPVVGTTITALRYRDGEGEGYYAADGSSQEAMFLRQPLRSGRTTSGFGMRLHPILHQMKAHYGVDFAAPTGTPVYAAADGVLVSAHRAGAAGNLVRLRHGDGYTTEYMHLHRFAAGLAAGDRLEKGDVIGFVGSSGRSTGPHLHFGVKRNGKYLDPTSTGTVAQPGLSARARKPFAAQAATLLDLINGLDKAGKVAGS
ncbi:MAG: M23 family metallopeptidase [Deltaproteobacteria bacterium]|nr:M23 family metallopeptidase [Deltaproteobacteria bacterium]